jgi:acylphosphatase
MTDADRPARLTAHVSGVVQGVGFRWFVLRRATELGLAGSAANLPDGRVLVLAEGPRDACTELLAQLRSGPGRPGRVERVDAQWGEPTGLAGFTTA